MELTFVVLWGIIIFTLLGLFFGIALAFTARKFHVPSNPLIDKVKDNLPAANCGACGFAGCQAYAEKVVEDSKVPSNLCIPGGENTAKIVAGLTNKDVGEIKDYVATLRCYGTTSVAKKEANYVGINTCSAAILSFGGPKACKNGCMGLGDCERGCPFDAIYIGEEGIAVVDRKKCTGCGVCVSLCPKGVLELYPRNHRVQLSCVSRDKANVVMKNCKVGCIICRKCVKACPANAIEWTNSTIKIDHDKCISYGSSCNEVCTEVCPSHILHRVDEKPVPRK